MLYVFIILIFLLNLYSCFNFNHSVNYIKLNYCNLHLFAAKQEVAPNSQVSKEEFIKTATELGIPEHYILDESENIVEPKVKRKVDPSLIAQKPLKKRLLKFKELLPEPGKIYPLSECIDRLKTISSVDFIEGVDIVLRFELKKGLTKNAAKSFSRLVSLPHKSLKSTRKKIAIFAPDEVVQQYNFEGADFVGDAELIEKFKVEKRPKIDVLLTCSDVVHKLAIVGKRLGSRKLMPSEAAGTLCKGWLEVIERLKLFRNFNTFTLTADINGDIKCNVADLSMNSEDIRSNILALVKELRVNKPSYASKRFIYKAKISSSMGPAYTLSLREIGAVLNTNKLQ